MIYSRRHIALTAAVLMLLGPGSALARQAQNAANGGRAFAERVSENVGIARFALIRPGLARGGEPNQDGLRYLRDHGYRTVVSFLTNDAESSWVVSSGMRYVHIPMASSLFSAQPPTQAQVRQFLSVVTDSTQYPVFIHCHAGKDRTGAMSAIYRMEACGWTKDEALAEMDSFGFSGRYRRLRGYVEAYPGSAAPTTATAQAAPAPSP
ncbi:MAG TPA: tyrosine-protein phosphatase [Candidatus Binatia bacterium]|nr:tyrosine-protein phosphatase [Candidatus Binatia bacterium]